MNEPMPQPEIMPGWDVRDIDGELVGTVIEATESYVLVEQGRFFPDDVYLPLDTVAGVEPGAITLNISGQTALDAGWHVGPPAGIGAFSTEYLAPGIALGGQVDELGTTEDDVSEDAAASTASVFRPEEIAYIESRLLGRLATVDADMAPHVVPVSHRYNRVLDTIDIGGHEDFAQSRKFRNVAATGRVALVIDDLDERRLPRGIEIRGRGEVHDTGGREIDPGFDDELIRIYPEHIATWGLPVTDGEQAADDGQPVR